MTQKKKAEILKTSDEIEKGYKELKKGLISLITDTGDEQLNDEAIELADDLIHACTKLKMVCGWTKEQEESDLLALAERNQADQEEDEESEEDEEDEEDISDLMHEDEREVLVKYTAANMATITSDVVQESVLKGYSEEVEEEINRLVGEWHHGDDYSKLKRTVNEMEIFHKAFYAELGG